MGANKMKLSILIALSFLAFAITGCQHVTVNYKSNVNATESQVNQTTETQATIPLR